MITSYSTFSSNLFKDGDAITKSKLNAAPSIIKKELNEISGTLDVLSGNPIVAWEQYSVYEAGEWVSYNGENYYSTENENYNAIPGTSSAWEISFLNSVAVTGDIEDLNFSATDIVDAINKVDTKANTNSSAIGYLTSLNTTSKDSLVSSINEILSSKGQPNGIASIDSTGKIFANQLPSYVDDVLEYTNFVSFPVEGETGKIYVDMMSSISYRWSGSVYTAISSGDVDWQYVRATPTTLSGYGITDAATIDNPSFTTAISLEQSILKDILTTTETTSQTPVEILDGTVFRSCELLVQVTRGTDFHITKINIVHNGTNSWFSEYGSVFTNGALATFSADYSTNKIRLLITPSSATSTSYSINIKGIKF